MGDHFVARLGIPAEPGWVEVDDLFGAGVLAAVGAARGTGSAAVAATLLFEQYAQRLAAAVLACLHRDGTLLDARLPRIRARVEDGRCADWRSPRLRSPHRPVPRAGVVDLGLLST
jgi:hypothetical protein